MSGLDVGLAAHAPVTVLAATEKSSSSISSILPLVVIVLLVVFLFQRTRRSRAKLAAQQTNSLAVGSEVVTRGGIVGRVTAVEDDEMVVEVAPGVRMRFLQSAVGQVRSSPEPELDETAPTEDTPFPQLPPDDQPPRDDGGKPA